MSSDAWMFAGAATFSLLFGAVSIVITVVVDWRRELVKSRKVIAYLYEHVWDANETVPQVRGRKLHQLQRYIEDELK